MAEYDIIKPAFPPLADPPPDHYEFLASVGLAEKTLGATCVKEVEITGITSITENTVQVLYDGVEYAGIPVWIQTDVGTRTRQIKGELATAPEQYFERAATLFPIQGGVQLTLNPADISVVPKALALIKVNQEQQTATPVGIISAVQSVRQQRGGFENVQKVFPTWKTYVKIKFTSFSYEIPEGSKYRNIPMLGGIQPADEESPPYIPVEHNRTVLYSPDDQGIAEICNASKDSFVFADTDAVGGATLGDIDAFLIDAITSSDIPSYDLQRPIVDTRFFIEPETQEGPITLYGWSGTVDKTFSPPDASGNQHVDMVCDLTPDWADVTGSYYQDWDARYSPSSGYISYSTGTAEYNVNKWAANMCEQGGISNEAQWINQTSTDVSGGGRNGLQQRGNFLLNLMLDGKSYKLSRYLENYNGILETTRDDPDILNDYNGTTEFHYTIKAYISEGTTNIGGYQFQQVSNLSEYESVYDGGTHADYSEYISQVSGQAPTIAGCNSFLTGETCLATLTQFAAGLSADHDYGVFSPITMSVDWEEANYYTVVLGHQRIATGIESFVNSVYQDFIAGGSTGNNPVECSYLMKYVNKNYTLYTPNNIKVEEATIYLVPYDMETALI